MGQLSAEERPIVGKWVNQLRDELTQALEARRIEIEEAELSVRLAA